MVTRYFRSKRELVLDTYQTMVSRSRAWLEQAVRGSDDPGPGPVQLAGSWKCQMTSDGRPPAARAADGR